jgi:hypothetical protein
MVCLLIRRLYAKTNSDRHLSWSGRFGLTQQGLLPYATDGILSQSSSTLFARPQLDLAELVQSLSAGGPPDHSEEVP